MRRTLLSVFCPALLLLTAVLWPRQAVASGRVREIAVGAVHVQRVWIPAGVAERITIDQLQPAAADSVIHVQTDHLTTGGDFIAGNDDCGSGLWSCVDIPSVSFGRWVTIIVRPWGNLTAGIGTLRSTNNLFPTTQVAFSGQLVSLGSLPAVSEVATVRQNRGDGDPNSMGGSNDTRLLIIASGNGGRAIAFDEDDGVGKMSAVTTNVDCGTGCLAMVGSGDGQVGVTIVDWDSDGRGIDFDGDGLSNHYESVSQQNSDPTWRSDPFKKDTDGDGISDAAELLGIDDTASIAQFLEFPFYGARPNRKDLFLELDWWPGFQMSTVEAGNLQGMFTFKPGMPSDVNDIFVHADIGQEGFLTQRYSVGNWGGATQIPSGGSDACAGFSAKRIGYFHHGILYGAAGTTPNYGDCFFSNGNAKTVAHETGHTLKLNHGGLPDPQMNTNLLYPSTMNYAFPAFPFSTNALGGLVVNPSSLNETSWAAAAPNANLDYLRPWLNIKGRAVDWNQDNIFSTTTGPGVVNIPQESTRISASKVATTANEMGHAMTWLPGAGFFYFTRRSTDNNTLYRFSTDIEAECIKFRANHWQSCATFGAAATVSGPKNLSFPAATWFAQNGHYTLALAYQSDQGKLIVQTGTWTGTPGAPISWAQVTVPNNPSMVGWPSVVRNPTNATEFFIVAGVYDPAGTSVRVWKYAAGAITGPTRTIWSTGGSFALAGLGGVTATLGFLKGEASASIFAAMTLPNNTMVFARYAPSDGIWTRLSGLDKGDQYGTFATTKQIGFAYQPFPGGVANDGRFWVAWTPVNTTLPYITKSVGNNPNAQLDANMLKPRVLEWNTKALALSVYDAIDAGYALSFEPGLDTNLRGAYVTGGGLYPVIEPLADGQANTNFNDHDDWKYLRGNLPCSLRNSGVPCLP